MNVATSEKMAYLQPAFNSMKNVDVMLDGSLL
jgi:hypothetical protein